MFNNEPFLLVDDDPNDIEVVTAAIRELQIPHPVHVCHTAKEAIDYLMATTHIPFVILCDIHMPPVNGLSLRKMIMDNGYLKQKSIPFLFLTVAVSRKIVHEAYMLDVQGFYKKGKNYEAIKEQMLAIYTYWKGCLHPNRMTD